MSVIDSIVKKKLIVTPEVVSADFETDFIDMSGVQDAYSIQLDYSNGNGAVDMDFTLAVSVDGNTYVPITDTQVVNNITDDSGTMIWEIAVRGVNFCKVIVTVNAGQLTIDACEYSGLRNH